MARNLKDAVVVITGASSGIGRASALAFAGKGAAVVVAARRDAALNDLVTEIEGMSAKVLAVPTDVTDEDAVQHLADEAVQRFGKIDVWVNDAGVILYGPFTETPLADYRRVMETNFFGCVNGSRAALKVFQEQGNGTLINLSSVVTRLPQPYASAYVASKHAVHALGMCLRPAGGDRYAPLPPRRELHRARAEGTAAGVSGGRGRQGDHQGVDESEAGCLCRQRRAARQPPHEVHAGNDRAIGGDAGRQGRFRGHAGVIDLRQPVRANDGRRRERRFQGERILAGKTAGDRGRDYGAARRRRTEDVEALRMTGGVPAVNEHR